MNNKPSFSLKMLPKYINDAEHRLSRYTIILFLILLVIIYGYTLYRINVLSNVQPNTPDISAQVTASASPHIDQNSVKQMHSLQDNSVSVQTLFNQARSNPFQE